MSRNKSSYTELEYYLVTKFTVKKYDEWTGFFKFIHSSTKFYSENNIKY